MERDFMGLNSKDSVVAVKQEVEEGCRKDPDLFASHGYMLKSGSDMMEQHLGVVQNFVGGNPFLSPCGVRPLTPSVAGTTDQWFGSKASATPQLTIFYGGTVTVFDSISPEKAQAIMLLAGSRRVSSDIAQSKFHEQALASKFRTVDRALLNQSMINVPPSSGLPSPMSVSSHPVDQSNVAAAGQDNVNVPITIGLSTMIVNKGQPPRMVSSMGPVAANAMMSAAVPQARKASLARFLEKRKERVMNASPYNLSKKPADCPTPDSTGLGFSASSGVGSSPVSASKEFTGDV